MYAETETRRQRAADPVGSRGGVWSLSEVLAELLPRYAAPAALRSEAVMVVSLRPGWQPHEAELAACPEGACL